MEEEIEGKEIEVKKELKEEIVIEGDKEIIRREETVSGKIGAAEPEAGKEEEKSEEEILEARKKKIKGFLKKSNLWVFAFLIIALILGVYIRSMPMQDHAQGIISFPKFVFMPWKAFGGNPGLWDITTNTWTLGPDLDPWLFARYAKIVVQEGALPEMDMMRNVPLGLRTGIETRLLPYMIAGTHQFLSIFSDITVEYTSALFPVIIFALTILAFFLFVREIFTRKNEKTTKANIIALISTFFMIVTPAFLSRTIAGIPEKESAAFFFMFLTLYFFLKGWKSEKLKTGIIFGLLAGISTAMMALIWGGVIYLFVTIAIASFAGFILNKIHKKEFVVYSLWIISSVILMGIFSGKFSFGSLLKSLDTGLAFLVVIILSIHFILWDTKLRIKKLEKINLPKNIISLIISIMLLIFLSSIFFGYAFIFEKLTAVHQMMFKPVTGRWSLTVAENRQPFFTEWGASFGPFIRNIPVMFWLFFIGSVVLFRKILSYIKRKDAWILTGVYTLFFFGLVFSRYSGSSIFNGENFISKGLYYLSALIFISTLIYYYIEYYKKENRGFDKIDYEYLLLFALFVLCLFTARSAVRLIMVLSPIAPIFVSFLAVDSVDKFKKSKTEMQKVILGVLMILIMVLIIYCFFGIPWNPGKPGYYQMIKSQAYNFIPSAYNQQWQQAMAWVRENTAEDAVFSHWWDYGYWVQSIGNRATVVDGGNAITYWNYLIGRLVLTGDNQKDALDFLYSHNTNYLLIDSTDIGKYTAFSSIGSDEKYDRFSWIPSMTSDQSQVVETRNGITRIYQGGSAVDEDLVYNKDEREIFLPAQSAAIAGIKIEISTRNNEVSFRQPEAIFFYQGQQFNIPLRYIYHNGKFSDFGSGLEAGVYILQRVYQTNQGMQIDQQGALMYLSPRLMRGLLAQIYLLNNPFNKFPNFKLAHSEPNPIINSLNSQGANLNEFIYYQGVQGPIKIWEIKYTGEEEIKQEYLDTDASKYIDWKL